jgi:hypothetical protein
MSRGLSPAFADAKRYADRIPKKHNKRRAVLRLLRKLIRALAGG